MMFLEKVHLYVYKFSIILLISLVRYVFQSRADLPFHYILSLFSFLLSAVLPYLFDTFQEVSNPKCFFCVQALFQLRCMATSCLAIFSIVSTQCAHIFGVSLLHFVCFSCGPHSTLYWQTRSL